VLLSGANFAGIDGLVANVGVDRQDDSNFKSLGSHTGIQDNSAAGHAGSVFDESNSTVRRPRKAFSLANITGRVGSRAFPLEGAT
jgi:hypothetical protein